MAIIEETKSRGEKKTDTLSGKISIDSSQNRLIGMSRSGIIQFLLIIDSDDGEPHLYMTKPGIDADQAR